MTPEAISTIRNALLKVVRPLDSRTTWPETIAHGPEGSDLWDELEDELLPTDDPDDPDPLADRPDTDLSPEAVIDETADRLPIVGRGGYGRVEEASRELREHFGEGWPGAPGEWDVASGGNGSVGSSKGLALFRPIRHNRTGQLGGALTVDQVYCLVRGYSAAFGLRSARMRNAQPLRPTRSTIKPPSQTHRNGSATLISAPRASMITPARGQKIVRRSKSRIEVGP